jgi:hypothetical protein
MALAASVDEYFNVLQTHPAGEARDAAWALENEASIRDELTARGPDCWYSKIEIIKGSGPFTEPHSIETPPETFYNSFGYGPAELVNKRVLDVGAFAGSMTFCAEGCGADVVALDIQDPQRTASAYSTTSGNRRQPTSRHPSTTSTPTCLGRSMSSSSPGSTTT